MTHIFDIKTDKSVTVKHRYISISKIFQIKFASFPVIIFPSNHLPKDFICTVAYFTDYSSLVFSLFYGSQVYKSLSFVLGDTMYLSRIFSHIFTWFLWLKDATPTKSLSLCKNTNNTHMQIITFEWWGYSDLFTFKKCFINVILLLLNS